MTEQSGSVLQRGLMTTVHLFAYCTAHFSQKEHFGKLIKEYKDVVKLLECNLNAIFLI